MNKTSSAGLIKTLIEVSHCTEALQHEVEIIVVSRCLRVAGTLNPTICCCAHLHSDSLGYLIEYPPTLLSGFKLTFAVFDNIRPQLSFERIAQDFGKERHMVVGLRLASCLVGLEEERHKVFSESELLMNRCHVQRLCCCPT